MKRNKYAILLLGGLLTLSCSDIDEQVTDGGSYTDEQIQDINKEMPERAEAVFAGMFSMISDPFSVFGSGQGRADDFGYPMIALSNDAEGADLWITNSGYNWFSVCGEWSSRDAGYANPYIRYNVPYNLIGKANEVIKSMSGSTDEEKWKIAQAKAMLTFGYLQLAPYFQFNYADHRDAPCVPIIREGVDYGNNPRASVEEVYKYMLDNATEAVEGLEGFVRTDKGHIDQSVALGLRARVELAMGLYAEAAADADRAMQGYTPASIADVSHPAFCDKSEANWMWSLNMTDAQAQDGGLATAASWFSAFTAEGYGAAVQCIPSINSLLYDKIPATDVRHGWWLDTDTCSPLLDGLTWADAASGLSASGQDIAGLEIENVKKAFLPYNNVKFGMKSGIGNVLNNNDFPLMRVEEMILIKAEGLARSGKAGEAKTVLEDFVRTYRDPAYSATAAGRKLEDEIWYQRRVELWGEGFATSDLQRLAKPMVRFHAHNLGNQPDAFRFNVAADDPWRLLRFAQTEMDNNAGIIDNKGGTIPVQGQNPDLLDGVTD